MLLGDIDGMLEAVAEGLELDNADGEPEAVILGIAVIVEGILDGRYEGIFDGDLEGAGFEGGGFVGGGFVGGGFVGLFDGAADILGWLLGPNDGLEEGSALGGADGKVLGSIDG